MSQCMPVNDAIDNNMEICQCIGILKKMASNKQSKKITDKNRQQQKLHNLQNKPAWIQWTKQKIEYRVAPNKTKTSEYKHSQRNKNTTYFKFHI